MKLFRITCSLVVLLLSLVAFAFVAVHPAAAQQALNPPPPSFETCKTVGNGTICQGARTVTDPLADAGFACTTGGSTFEVFSADEFNQHATRFYDQNGNLTRRSIYDNYSFGQFSNPQAGSVVPFTQVTNEKDSLAVPGDLSSATAQFTGEIIFKPAHGSPVALQVGRIVSNLDQSVIFFEKGPDAFTDYFVEGDTSALAALCAALAERSRKATSLTTFESGVSRALAPVTPSYRS
jgi:hypothetical protein